MIPPFINTRDKSITSAMSVRLFDLRIDNRLNFGPHISALCKKAVAKLNPLSRLSSFTNHNSAFALLFGILARQLQIN